MDGTFDEVYARYAGAVHGYLARLTGDAAAADELCQETFLRYARRERSLLEANGHLRGWLFRVATNAAIDRMRRRRAAPLGPEPPAPSTPEPAESRDLAARVRAELAAMPPELRGTFLLRAHHELPYAEVAAAFGITERAAKDRFRKVRDLLARRLAHLHEGEGRR